MINHPNRSRARRATSLVADAPDSHDVVYGALLRGVQAHFDSAKASPLFTTDAEGLYDDYLDMLPADRQVHSCTACRRFVETFGGLVTVADDGSQHSAIWPEITIGFYAESMQAMRAHVRRARITGPFLAARPTLGTPTTGPWNHLAVTGARVFRAAVLTSAQAAAARREDRRTVAAALADFTAPTLDVALGLLRDGHLHRSERFVAPLAWLRALHDRPRGRPGENLLWRAVATAPEGFCHPRAAVTGSLLEDIASGAFLFADIKRRFDAKVGGLVYQRPQAPPREGNRAAAEALFAQLGLAPSLERRFARLDEVETIWRPAEASAPAAGGVFGHVGTRSAKPVQAALRAPSVTMTWEKFARTVLPGAERLYLLVPSSFANFTALLTAADIAAPPIIRWDLPEARNPVSSYVYHNGSLARDWGLVPGEWVRVIGVARRPNEWGAQPRDYLGQGATLLLAGAVDSRTGQGNALFPEILREELRGVRATIEAYSRTAVIGGRAEASACGLALGREGAANCRLRVGTAEYVIDRWD